MKITIIDIKKEIRDFEKMKQQMNKLEYENLCFKTLEDGSSPACETVQAEYKTYFLEKIYDNVNGDRYYYVQKDDNKIFNDLLMINTKDINSKIEDSKQEVRETIQEELHLQKNNIKRLSWWKRLFNEF